MAHQIDHSFNDLESLLKMNQLEQWTCQTRRYGVTSCNSLVARVYTAVTCWAGGAGYADKSAKCDLFLSKRWLMIALFTSEFRFVKAAVSFASLGVKSVCTEASSYNSPLRSRTPAVNTARLGRPQQDVTWLKADIQHAQRF